MNCTMHKTVENGVLPYVCHLCGLCFVCRHKLTPNLKAWVCEDGTKQLTKPSPGVEVKKGGGPFG